MHHPGPTSIEQYRAWADMADRAIAAGDFESADFAVGRLFGLFGWMITDSIFADERVDMDARSRTSYIRLATNRLGAAGLRTPHWYVNAISNSRAPCAAETVAEPPFVMPPFRGIGVR